MIRSFVLAGAGLSCAASAAQAALDPAVVVPWGDALVALGRAAQAVLEPLLTALAAGFIARCGPLAAQLVTRTLIEGVVERLTDYALNAVEGAAKGRVLTVPVGSAVIAAAVQRAADAVPGVLIRAAGGLPGIAEKVFRRLDLEERASAANTLAPALDAARLSAP